MKSVKKSLFAIILTLCVALCVGLFTACKGENTPPSDDVTYTVTVKTDATAFASGVTVTLSKGSAKLGTATTGVDGKATFTAPKDDYTVSLSKLPAHYQMPEDADLSLSADKKELTITLARAFAYEVKLVNPDNTPFYADGVKVGVCTFTGNCLAPVNLGKDGVALIEQEKNDYHVQILGLKNYVYECDKDGYYTGKNFSATETKMTVTVYPATVLDGGEPLTAEQKKALTSKFVNYSEFMYDYTAYSHKVAIAAGDVAYFKFTPELTASYVIFSLGDFTHYFGGDSFSLTAQEGDDYFQAAFGREFVMEADKTYFFTVQSNSAATTEILFLLPSASYTVLDGVAQVATVDVTINDAKANAVIALTPKTAGSYTATVKGAALTNITSTLYSPDAYSDPAADADYVAEATKTVKLTASNLGTTVFFTIKAKGPFPQNFKVEIKNNGAIVDEYVNVTVKEKLERKTAPLGSSLVPVPVNGTAKLVYNDTDKSYHIGSASGSQVVVNITKETPSRTGEPNGLAYLDKNTLLQFKYVITETNDDPTKGDKLTDYREFIRGFKDYAGEEFAIPSPLTQTNCYANFVDENGCYPLTKELETFLKAIVGANANFFDWNVPGSDNWLFACYVYGDPVAVDPIVDEYRNSPGEDEEQVVLKVNADNTFVIEATGGVGGTTELDGGTWSKDGAEYSFVCTVDGATLTYSDGKFTYVSGDSTYLLASEPAVTE